jgi:RimJ/RimL family protein N-acetyltransferase
MIEAPERLETQRLILRAWQNSDVEIFQAMNAHPQTMEFFPSLFTYEQTAKSFEKNRHSFAKRRVGFWALELKGTGEVIGFSGLIQPDLLIHCACCYELGYRIHHRFWGKGYGTEAALEAIKDGFGRLQLSEIVACTAAINKRSIRVMEKVKMQREEQYDFFHPAVPERHPLRPHVLYRLTASA